MTPREGNVACRHILLYTSTPYMVLIDSYIQYSMQHTPVQSTHMCTCPTIRFTLVTYNCITWSHKLHTNARSLFLIIIIICASWRLQQKRTRARFKQLCALRSWYTHHSRLARHPVNPQILQQIAKQHKYRYSHTTASPCVAIILSYTS